MVLSMSYLPLGDPFIRKLFIQLMDGEVKKLTKINENWEKAFTYLLDTYLKDNALYQPQGQI